jgi:hypothetical protein
MVTEYGGKGKDKSSANWLRWSRRSGVDGVMKQHFKRGGGSSLNPKALTRRVQAKGGWARLSGCSAMVDGVMQDSAEKDWSNYRRWLFAQMALARSPRG